MNMEDKKHTLFSHSIVQNEQKDYEIEIVPITVEIRYGCYGVDDRHCDFYEYCDTDDLDKLITDTHMYSLTERADFFKQLIVERLKNEIHEAQKELNSIKKVKVQPKIKAEETTLYRHRKTITFDQFHNEIFSVDIEDIPVTKEIINDKTAYIRKDDHSIYYMDKDLDKIITSGFSYQYEDMFSLTHNINTFVQLLIKKQQNQVESQLKSIETEEKRLKNMNTYLEEQTTVNE